MKTVFTFILLVVFFGNVFGGNDPKTIDIKTIEIQTTPSQPHIHRPKSIRHKTIAAYYSVVEKVVVVEFKRAQGMGVVELKDGAGNTVETKTEDTSIQEVVTLSLPVQPGKYTLFIRTELQSAEGDFDLEY